ncbi:MAG: 4Fe-4S binding protein [Pseudomonadota bacterium]
MKKKKEFSDFKSKKFDGPKAEIEVIPDFCKACGICVEFCPQKVLEIRNFKIYVAKPEECTGCMLCEYRCPDFAIKITKKEKKKEK